MIDYFLRIASWKHVSGIYEHIRRTTGKYLKEKRNERPIYQWVQKLWYLRKVCQYGFLLNTSPLFAEYVHNIQNNTINYRTTQLTIEQHNQRRTTQLTTEKNQTRITQTRTTKPNKNNTITQEQRD